MTEKAPARLITWERGGEREDGARTHGVACWSADPSPGHPSFDGNLVVRREDTL